MGMLRCGGVHRQLPEAARSRSWCRRHGCMRRRFGCSCSMSSDPRYRWTGRLGAVRCGAIAGMHEWNTIAHVTDYEGDPLRRLQVRFCIWRSRSSRAASEDFGCLVGVLGRHARDVKSACAAGRRSHDAEPFNGDARTPARRARNRLRTAADGDRSTAQPSRAVPPRAAADPRARAPRRAGRRPVARPPSARSAG